MTGTTMEPNFKLLLQNDNDINLAVWSVKKVKGFSDTTLNKTT